MGNDWQSLYGYRVRGVPRRARGSWPRVPKVVRIGQPRGVRLRDLGIAACGVALAGALGAAWGMAGSDRQARGPDAPIEWNEVQAVPRAEPDPADAEWLERAREADASAAAEPSAGPGRVGFDLCHSGGGFNCVVDGDTIWFQGHNIRLADIDAPETHEPRCAAEQALGDRATRRLHALVNSGAVTLGGIGRDRDRYGRLLRIVAVDGQSAGEVLVGEGLARWYAGGRRPWC